MSNNSSTLYEILFFRLLLLGLLSGFRRFLNNIWYLTPDALWGDRKESWFLADEAITLRVSSLE